MSTVQELSAARNLITPRLVSFLTDVARKAVPFENGNIQHNGSFYFFVRLGAETMIVYAHESLDDVTTPQGVCMQQHIVHYFLTVVEAINMLEVAEYSNGVTNA